jgi:alkanesulfonate monooxygenase SsuD/methylene tetrahydromethanopterin reductase-like flavin-dependent oxidoreductase (luciferase family)
LTEFAVSLEKAGFHRVWTTESPGRDAIIRAAHILGATSTLRSGTGISFAFARSPLAVAGASADVYSLSGGRFSLGLGGGTRGQRRWYSQEFDHPADRFADYVRVVRAVLCSKGAVRYSGKYYDISVPRVEMLEQQVPLTSLKIYGGGLHRRMLTAVAGSCDGLVLHPLAGSSQYLDTTVLPIIQKTPNDLEVTPELIIWCPVSVSKDSGEARRKAAEQLAFYFSTPSYLDVATELGFGEIASELVRRFNDRVSPTSFSKLAESISDEMLSFFVVWGNEAEVRNTLESRFREWESRGVAEVSLQLPSQGSDSDGTRESIEILERIIRLGLH